MALLLELFGVGGVVGILIAEELVGNFTREQHADIRLLVYGFADEIHAHGGTDRRYIEGFKSFYYLFKTVEHELFVDINFGVLAADVVGDHAGVLQIYGVLAHAHGEGAYLFALFFVFPGGNGADEGAVEPAREQKADGRVGFEPLYDALGEQTVYVFINFLVAVVEIFIDGGYIAVADELAVLIVVPGREGIYLFGKGHEHLCFGCEHYVAAL